MRRILLVALAVLSGCGTSSSAPLTPPALTREHASVVEYERRQKELQTPGGQVYFNEKYPLTPGRIGYGHFQIVEILDDHRALADVNGGRVVIHTDTKDLWMTAVIGYEKPMLVGDPVPELSSDDNKVYSVVPVDLEALLGPQHPLP